MIELKCNNCGRTVKVPEMLADKLQPDSPAGRVFKCPGCGQGLGGAERQTSPQSEQLKCAQCGKVVADAAEFVRGKGLCAECSHPTQPAEAAAGQAENAVQPGSAPEALPGGQVQQQNDAEKPADKFVPISKSSPQAAPWKNQPRRQMQPAAGPEKKTRKAGRESFLFWGLGGIVVLAGIGLIMHLVVFRDTWEEDHRDKAVEMRQEAKSLASRGAFEQAAKKYQALIDLLSSRRLQSSELKDLLAKARSEMADAQKSFERQQGIARQQHDQAVKYLAGFEPLEQQARAFASAGQYEKAVASYEQIISSIEERPDRSPEVLQVISRLNQERSEASQKLRDKRQAEAASQKAKEDEEARLAAEKVKQQEEEKARLLAEQKKKEEDVRLAQIKAATQPKLSQNPSAQSSPAGNESPTELSRLRQSDVKALKDSIRTIQDFVAAYRPVHRLAQSSGSADDLLVLAERVQQAGSMLFAPAFEQAPAQQSEALKKWRENCNQTVSDALAACQTIQRNVDDVCKIYKTMKIGGMSGDSGAKLLKQLDERNSAEWLRLQELLQQATEIAKGG